MCIGSQAHIGKVRDNGVDPCQVERGVVMAGRSVRHNARSYAFILFALRIGAPAVEELGKILEVTRIIGMAVSG